MSRIKEALLKFALDSDGELLKLPLLMLMQTIFGGYKGSGKTTAMKKLFEAAHEAGAQCVAAAPLGKWWSLRIAKNGKGKGLKGVVVFGGEFGDVPILPGSGQVIARTVHEKKLHAVLDVELMYESLPVDVTVITRADGFFVAQAVMYSANPAEPVTSRKIEAASEHCESRKRETAIAYALSELAAKVAASR